MDQINKLTPNLSLNINWQSTLNFQLAKAQKPNWLERSPFRGRPIERPNDILGSNLVNISFVRGFERFLKSVVN